MNAGIKRPGKNFIKMSLIKSFQWALLILINGKRLKTPSKD
jgi:hypothetical protein